MIKKNNDDNEVFFANIEKSNNSRQMGSSLPSVHEDEKEVIMSRLAMSSAVKQRENSNDSS